MFISSFKFLHKPNILRGFAAFLTGVTLLSSSITAHAGIKEDNIAVNQLVAVESNQIAGWPQGPTVSARSAILMELETGTILYAKNIHNKEYPASITKILTTLIATEECAMDEMVTFSKDAIFDIDRGSNHIALDVGEAITVEQCLNAILIRSANEVSLGLAEHITGDTWESFADIMNERAKELGALNSHFYNPNGLPHEDHYTTAYDMAMIGRAFFSNEILCNITTTRKLHIPPSDTQPDDIIEYNQMSLIKGGKYAYEHLVGCKTGYTNDARSTLVSCAEKDGLKLICVVLRDEAPYQYEDTLALFEYGFANFRKLNVSENDTKYRMDAGSSFYSENDILGNSKPILSLNTSDYIVLPNTVDFDQTYSQISYDTDSATEAAIIQYTYQGWPIGSATIDFTGTLDAGYEFESYVEEEPAEVIEETPQKKPLFQHKGPNNKGEDTEKAEPVEKAPLIKRILKAMLYIVLGLLGLTVLAIVVLFIYRYIRIRRRRNRRRRRVQTIRLSSDPYAVVNKKRHRQSQIADAKRRQRAARKKRRNARWR